MKSDEKEGELFWFGAVFFMDCPVLKQPLLQGAATNSNFCHPRVVSPCRAVWRYMLCHLVTQQSKVLGNHFWAALLLCANAEPYLG